MQLKLYQEATLDVLGKFLADARMHGPALAYVDIVAAPEQAERLKTYKTRYKPLNGMAGTPYVCLRLPTGGGKTILAAHAIKVAGDNWLEREYPLVLWLVPSNIIRMQTVEALKKAGHPYRQALDDAFDGRVRIFDIADFTQLLPHDLKANCCVVVATIQTLRVSTTDGRKVYAHHEMLEPHFTGVSPTAPGLELQEGVGKIRFSFANLLHLHRPLMLVDEAHNAVTGLSREMQARVNPAAIIEFTATPDVDSNILHAVSAQEVKAAEMIKLPIVLSEHQTWQQAVSAAIIKRAELAAIATKDHDYIRPIVLFQAQPKDEEVSVAVLKQHLIDNEGIEERRIAIATGSQRELDDINLFDANSPIEFIITVEALKEGWDCSFAYVFCSVANIRSTTAAEQLLGRVLRMPYATKRTAKELNKAYATLVSKSFAQAANDLRDRLVDMGFQRNEAEQNIEVEQPELADGLFGRQRRVLPSTSINLPLAPEAASAVSAAARGKVAVDPVAGTVTIKGFLKPAEKQEVLAALPSAQRQSFETALATHEADNFHLAAPAERGDEFIAPALAAWVQGELRLVDSDLLLEHDWRLSDHSAQLDSQAFSLRQESNTFEIDIAGERLLLQHSDQSAQLLMDIPVEGLTEQALVRWLDREIRDANIFPADKIGWLASAVSHLTGPRGISLSALKECQYILMRTLKDRIAAIKQRELNGVYQRLLFGPEARAGLDFNRAFRFFEGMFDDVPPHEGQTYRFNKHFLGWDKVPAFDGKDNGEEEQCALALESQREVKHWVRNVAKHQNAFWIQTATDRFYPDFVAELIDGRVFVVEYKGPLAELAKEQHKKAIGELWGSIDGSKALFAWVEKEVGGQNMHDQMRSVIESSGT